MAVIPSEEPTIAPSIENDEATLAAEPGSARAESDPFAMRAGPTRLGHHVLLHVLGRGGMGVVYAAYDEKLDRKVAIKLLLGRGGATVQRRLAREAQALARLSHPNVVQIYEIGEWQELAFLVMEFIDGVTLREYLAEPGRSRAQLLSTFVAAGRGLAAAHAQGLVHRDFKPDNVMVRRDGRVVVMDFGLARGRDSLELEGADRVEPGIERSNELSQQLTVAGSLTGTPAYMAPEQFLGTETDARTDQFSFCVALWEALFGQRPFRGESMAALMLAVTQGERVEPSGGDVPTWLRRVLDRGLALRPDDRWPAMADLLLALERDPTRRRRAMIAGFGGLALTAAAVVGVQVVRAQQREHAIAECAEAGQAITADWNEEVAAALEARFGAPEFAPTGPSAWSHTRPWIEQYAESWARLRTQTCREARVEQTRSEESLDSITQCLDQRRALVAGLIETWGHADRKLVMRAPVAAAGLSAVDGCLSEIGEHEPPPSEIVDRVGELRVASEQVRAMQLAGEYDPALIRANAILADARALEWLPLIADAELLVAATLLKLGKYAEARTQAEAAFLDALASGDEFVMLAAAQTLTYLVGYQMGEHEAGLYWGQIGERLIDRLGLRETSREAGLLEDIGQVLSERGAFAEAVEVQRRALEIERATLGPDHPNVASCLINYGGALARTGDHVAAREHFERAIEIKQATLGPEHPDVATALHNIGVIQMFEGQYVDSVSSFERALALREATLGREHPQVAHTLANLGFVQNATGQSDAAIASLRRALEILAAQFGPEHPQLVAPLNNLGLVYVAQGQDDLALEQFRRALAISTATSGAESPETAGSRLNIADVLFERGAWVEAREHYSQALVDLAGAPDHPWVGLAKSGVTRVDFELGERAGVRAQLEQALAIEVKTHAEPIELAKTRLGLARVLWAEGDLAGAREQAKLAREQALVAGKVGARVLARIDAWRTEHAIDE
ncbi:tetratricopeptide repeat protein [Nannocystaceae bacterium ST9]